MLERGVSGEGTGRGGGGTGLGRKGKPRRWELRFKEGNTLDTYARQLDYFGIELGVLMEGEKVLYVSKLAQMRPRTRQGPRDQEKRYRFTWKQGSLEQADRMLLARANIEVGGSIIFKFLPPPLYQRLRVMEAEHAGAGRSVRRCSASDRAATTTIFTSCVNPTATERLWQNGDRHRAAGVDSESPPERGLEPVPVFSERLNTLT